MTDWHALRDAYGPADAVPTLLARLTPDQTNPAWGEIWSRLCHQGTVYPASFAALPPLEALAGAWSAPQRDPILHLAGAIVCSTDRVDIAGDPVRPLEPVIHRLRALASESLTTGDRSDDACVYLLQAMRGLEGDALWGTRLDGLVDGEISARCPQCGADLYVVIGDDRHFVAAEEWLDRPRVPREPITPGGHRLDLPGDWIRQQAAAAGKPDLAARVEYLFGTSRCPACAGRIQIAPAIACQGEPE